MASFILADMFFYIIFCLISIVFLFNCSCCSNRGVGCGSGTACDRCCWWWCSSSYWLGLNESWNFLCQRCCNHNFDLVFFKYGQFSVANELVYLNSLVLDIELAEIFDFGVGVFNWYASFYNYKFRSCYLKWFVYWVNMSCERYFVNCHLDKMLSVIISKCRCVFSLNYVTSRNTELRHWTSKTLGRQCSWEIHRINHVYIFYLQRNRKKEKEHILWID